MDTTISKQSGKLERGAEEQEEGDSQYCLRWNNFQANIMSQFEALRGDEDFTDVTFSCEGQRIQAHKVVLSACSPLFKDLFKSNPCPHPIIFMQDVHYSSVTALVEFMYTGQVNVDQQQLAPFLKIAKSFQIRGLVNCDNRAEGFCSNEVGSGNKETLASDGINVAIDDVSQQALADATASELQKNHHDLVSFQSTTTKKLRSVNNKSGEDASRLHDEPDVEVLQQPKLEPGERENNSSHINHPGHTYAPSINEASGNLSCMPIQMSLDPHLDSFENNFAAASRSNLSRGHILEPRTCEECGRTYSNLSNLRQHLKLVHFSTSVACTMCTKTFKTDLYLRRHLKNSHDLSNHNNFHTYIRSSSRFK